MVTDEQVRRLFAMKNKVKYLYQLADKAGMSTKTVMLIKHIIKKILLLIYRGSLIYPQCPIY